jgi:1-aminocyclopropane-1-carboxylate deaminase/D-cysteine desulfhydrase-like pyridoxal-dependent ACC family enzyme
LATIPRVTLGHGMTPVVALSGLSSQLWIKRDDLFADPVGGNKVRALEYLFGDLNEDDEVVTVGSTGSTHALSVSTYGARLGARVHVARWQQEMNAAAERVSTGISRRALEAPVFRTPVPRTRGHGYVVHVARDGSPRAAARRWAFSDM